MLTDTLRHNRRQQILILELQPFKRQLGYKNCTTLFYEESINILFTESFCIAYLCCHGTRHRYDLRHKALSRSQQWHVHTHKHTHTPQVYILQWNKTEITSCVGGCHNMPPPLWPWPLTLKVVSESRVTWATSVPILVFLGFSVLNLGPMYTTDRHQTDRRQTASLLNPPA